MFHGMCVIVLEIKCCNFDIKQIGNVCRQARYVSIIGGSEEDTNGVRFDVATG